MKRHSRKHIYEAIAYWKKQLRQLDESMHAGQDDAAMTLDDAIQHCYEVASRATTCQSCAGQHLQLAAWLEELKKRRMQDIAALRDAQSFNSHL